MKLHFLARQNLGLIENIDFTELGITRFTDFKLI
jgi:hypothetical protein